MRPARFRVGFYNIALEDWVHMWIHTDSEGEEWEEVCHPMCDHQGWYLIEIREVKDWRVWGAAYSIFSDRLARAKMGTYSGMTGCGLLDWQLSDIIMVPVTLLYRGRVVPRWERPCYTHDDYLEYSNRA